MLIQFVHRTSMDDGGIEAEELARLASSLVGVPTGAQPNRDHEHGTKASASGLWRIRRGHTKKRGML